MKITALDYEHLKECLYRILDMDKDDYIYYMCLQGYLMNVNQSFAERKISVADRRELINPILSKPKKINKKVNK